MAGPEKQAGSAGEFSLIDRYLRPLAGEGALDLADDAAFLEAENLVITKDALVAGTHFLPDDPLAEIARKALRVNLSDCAAMGAKAFGYFLALVLPQEADEDLFRGLSEGLTTDQEQFGLSLLGGDTTRQSGQGPLSLCVTMLARPLGVAPVRRCGAKPGDLLFVTGTIGDGWLGLQSALGRPAVRGRHEAEMLARYRLPQPRVQAARAVSIAANACLDISDGLVADARHLAQQSGVGLEIDAATVPLSGAGKAFVTADDGTGGKAALTQLLTGGDDYELLCTVPPDRAGDFINAAAPVPVTQIGQCTEGHPGEVMVTDRQGKPLTIGTAGYDHFAGR